MTQGKTFLDFLESIEILVQELEAHPEDAEHIRLKFWRYGEGEAPVVLSDIYTQCACTIAIVTTNTQLSPELKLMVIEQMKQGVLIAVSMCDTAVKSLKKEIVEQEHKRAEREMRRKIAASIGGMGVHPERRKRE